MMTDMRISSAQTQAYLRFLNLTQVLRGVAPALSVKLVLFWGGLALLLVLQILTLAHAAAVCLAADKPDQT